MPVPSPLPVWAGSMKYVTSAACLKDSTISYGRMNPKPMTPAEVSDYYLALADTLSRPVVIYNAPWVCNQLSFAQLRKLAEHLKYAPFARGNVIAKQGTPAQHWLFIIITTVHIYLAAFIDFPCTLDFFGLRELEVDPNAYHHRDETEHAHPAVAETD